MRENTGSNTVFGTGEGGGRRVDRYPNKLAKTTAKKTTAKKLTQKMKKK